MIFLACLLTIVIEGGFLALCGYRDRFSLTVIICANAVTNLLLNLLIWFAFNGDPGAWIYLMEACVVAAEYAIYAKAFGRDWNLFLLTLAANVISYVIGLLFF